MKKYFLLLSILSLFLFNNFIYSQNKNAIVETTKITDNIYKLEVDKFANIIALLGPEGVLIIDSGFDDNLANGYTGTASAVKAELKKLGNDNIKYIINTHSDDDHVDGNKALGNNAVIIAHKKCRDVLSKTGNFPKEGLPSITVDDSLKMFLNGEEILIKHLPGHKDHDVIIEFRNAKIVFVGDLIIPDSFGSISNTGNIDNLISTIDYIYKRYGDDYKIAPGHDRLISRADVKEYHNMLVQTSAIIKTGIEKDKTLETMLKEDVLKDWKKWNGKYFPVLNADTWTAMIYSSIIKKYKKSAADEMLVLIRKSGFENSKKEIESILSDKKIYYVTEREINLLGYNLLYEKKTKDAIEVFKLNVKLYPDSWNVYDSLGEGYMNDNQNDLAIQFYGKSLKVNPQNTNATKILEKLKK